MKKTLFLLISVIGIKTMAQNVTIPNPQFKKFLVENTAINTNGDTEIQMTEATAFSGAMFCSDKNIGDLTGIEAFTALTRLDCGYNELTSLDVSANEALTILNCRNNQLTSLDVSANTALIELTCEYNQLTNLDVSANTALVALKCVFNQLTSLNLANGNNANMTYMRAAENTELTCIQVDEGIFWPTGWTKIPTGQYSTTCGATVAEYVNIPNANFKAALVSDLSINTDEDAEISVVEAEAYTGTINVSGKSISDLTGIEAFVNITTLHCHDNQLFNLDLSKNTALTALGCTENYISSLNISKNTALTSFSCRDNQLSSLDVSNNTALTELYCYNNLLTSLDVSANTLLTLLRCEGNSNLTCIKVNDLAQPTTSWQKDEAASWNINCEYPNGINKKENQLLSIYPNPATSTIYLAEGEVQIFDQLGNLVMTEVSNGKVDVSTLKSGVYIVAQQAEKAKLIIE